MDIEVRVKTTLGTGSKARAARVVGRLGQCISGLLLSSTAALVLAPAARADEALLQVAESASFEVDPESSTLAKCWSSGAGAAFMKWCVSEHGNLRLESPATRFLIPAFNEGYAVCSRHPQYGTQYTMGYDAGHMEGAFGPAVVSYPSSSTAQVTRTTSDGKIQLVMKFSRDSSELDVTVQTTVTNVSSGKLSDVRLTRYASNESGGGLSDKTSRTLWWRWQPDTSTEPTYGLSLNMPTVAGGAKAGAFHDFYTYWWEVPSYCQPDLSRFGYTPPSPGAYADTLYGMYYLGDLNPGQQKTVKHIYRRL